MQPDQSEDFLNHLRGIPFVRQAALRPASAPNADYELELATADERYRLIVQVKSSPVRSTMLEQFVSKSEEAGGRWILFAPKLESSAADGLARRGVNYLDLGGNCHLSLDGRYVTHIAGRPLPAELSRVRDRGLRATGHQVVFGLLADPGLVDAPVRTIAVETGISKSACDRTLATLEAEGFVQRVRKRRTLQRIEQLRERWLLAYPDVLRPHLILGRYAPGERDHEALERMIEANLAELSWAYGGAAAAYRWTRHYRSESTVLHIDARAEEVARRLRALPSATGSLVLLKVPGPIALRGYSPHTVHPLLAYAELVVDGSDRALEAAREVRQRFIEAAS